MMPMKPFYVNTKFANQSCEYDSFGLPDRFKF